MNKVILVGRLGKDVEVRYTQNGKCVASFSLAVTRTGVKDVTDWIDIVAWEKLAEICGNHLGKGSKILVEGRLQIRSYETADAQKRRIAEVVAQNVEFLDSKQTAGGASGGSGAYDVSSLGSEVFPEEEIPF